MHIYIYVDMYICIYTYMCIYNIDIHCIHIYGYNNIYIYIHMYIYNIYVYTYIYIYMWVLIYIYTHTDVVGELGLAPLKCVLCVIDEYVLRTCVIDEYVLRMCVCARVTLATSLACSFSRTSTRARRDSTYIYENVLCIQYLNLLDGDVSTFKIMSCTCIYSYVYFVIDVYLL